MPQEPSVEQDEIGKNIVDSAIFVHRELGPGLLESVYEVCLQDVLEQRGFAVERQKPIPVHFQKKKLDAGFRADLIVNERVLIEIKSIDKLSTIHDAQILTYLKLSGISLGFLLNFNARLMKEGMKRFYRA